MSHFSAGNSSRLEMEIRHEPVSIGLLSSAISTELKSNKMGLRKLLRLPKFHSRKRSRARSENIEGPSGVGLSVPPPAESAPDLRIGASTSPLTPHDQKSNGTRTVSSQKTHLTVFPSHKAGRPSDSDEHRPVSNSAENASPKFSDPVDGPSAVDENKSNLKSLASSGAKWILRGVNQSADAFGPLKSVAGGLCFILDNCEVRGSPASAVCNAYTRTSK